MAKRWSDLSPAARRFILVAGTLDTALKAAALWDLKGRAPEQVRGSKAVWATAIGLVNSVGVIPAAYLVVGRR